MMFLGLGGALALVPAMLGFVGVAVQMIRFALLASRLPDLPIHARLNPFNVLAMRDRWTPTMRDIHDSAVRWGLLFLGGVAVALFVSLL
jgi:hypothetical protein